MKLFNKEVFIIGGGESLKYFDFDRLKGKDVIACNVAFKWVPWCKVVTFWDQQFWRKYGDELLAHPAYKVTIEGLAHGVEDDKIMRFDPNINGNVNDTGHFSIRIALNFGAEIIYLLGFDADGGHFHDEYPEEWKSSNWFHSHFGCYAQELIYNCNPDSKIKTFDFININDIL